MARRTGTFLKEFVILFGFLNGVWLAVGVNPGAEILDVIRGTLAGLISGNILDFLFTFLPLALLAATLYFIFRKGGWIGFLAVACAFIAGLQVTSAPGNMFVLLLVALGLGWWATR